MHHELDWFIAIAEAENLTAAGEQVHVSQPTLSRFVGRLEHDLGVDLFERHGRRLVLNRFGRVYLERARRARAQLDAARREVDEMRRPAQGMVRLAFLHSFGVTLVPDLIRRFRDQNPQARFTLTQDAAATVVDHVADGDADLAIVSPRPMRTDMAWFAIAEQELALVVPRGHRFADRTTIGLAEAADEEFIVMERGFGMRRIFDELCAAADIAPAITFSSAELSTITGLVGAGLGVGVVPVDDAVRARDVALVPLTGESREIGLTWFRPQPLSEAAERFRDFVVASR
ncbi:LysR family transcriptional regulator [Gordonia insulae]|uniref:HTH-type transcriptional regulator GltC n=1 Tax=Gordonia insulae TaxID=2420509 RepID=A0A3G8JPE3_9ACTN|nr:LysR family transcriptional regulator [Gordonia insulae]AZG46951.1 HTH-type transcriptional regulator GltC [Gordonia insulae]